VIALGEVMLRLDPGEDRIATARSFRVWEGGGEYNVVRGLQRCFGQRTALVSALADNPIGRLLEGLLREGGVDLRWLQWVPYDGIGRSVRNGLNFTERGFGPRAALGCSDRANSAASQLRIGSVDWEEVFSRRGVRWLHTGAIFSALSPTTAEIAEEAMLAARQSGAVVSYDVNVRESLWRGNGANERAVDVNRRLVSLSDVVFGNEKNFATALGLETSKSGAVGAETGGTRDVESLGAVASEFPGVRVVASTVRSIHSASRNDWGGVCWADGEVSSSDVMASLEVLDRVGGGDAFAAGMIYGFLEGMPAAEALQYGVAHGALAMSTPGDSSMASLDEVRRLVSGESARILR
jgi:2-dehydro-3-deoxygluconokinase